MVCCCLKSRLSSYSLSSRLSFLCFFLPTCLLLLTLLWAWGFHTSLHINQGYFFNETAGFYGSSWTCRISCWVWRCGVGVPQTGYYPTFLTRNSVVFLWMNASQFVECLLSTFRVLKLPFLTFLSSFIIAHWKEDLCSSHSDFFHFFLLSWLPRYVDSFSAMFLRGSAAFLTVFRVIPIKVTGIHSSISRIGALLPIRVLHLAAILILQTQA